MTLREFVRSKKTLSEAGAWSDKKMPKSGGKFPLSRARSFRVGDRGWRWRVMRFDCCGRDFVLLITYHAGKQNYLAVVATPIGTDLLVLGALENHSTHSGWHVHASCRPVASSNSGRMRYPDMQKIPSGKSINASLPFPADDVLAYEIAARYFRLPHQVQAAGAQIPILLQMPQGGAS